MRIPNKTGEGELIEKKSRFISNCFYIESEQEAAEKIQYLRKKYWDSRHVVYAFVLADGTARFSDDNEPHGTAGKPVLSVIQGADLKNCLITVVRYFGGTLLGTGGLVKAYGESAKLALLDSGIAETVTLSVIRVTCAYDQYEKLVRLITLAGGTDVAAEYGENIEIKFVLEEEKRQDFEKNLTENFSARLKAEKCGEKTGKIQKI